MTPEECEGCQYFDGEDICEAMRKDLGFVVQIFPIPIACITDCKWVEEEKE